MNKHYTSIEQSRKLSELGLSPETADMKYSRVFKTRHEPDDDWEISVGSDVAFKRNLFSFRAGYVIPCWSLGALIDVLPKGITIKNKWKEINHLGDKIHYDCHILLSANTVVYECTVEEAPKHHILAMYENDSLEGENTLMNNVYRMVCWALENNHIHESRLIKNYDKKRNK